MKVSIVTRTTDRPSLSVVQNEVINQTYKNIEHIIIRGFDRFQAAAEGFKLVTGDVVLLLDDDDHIEPNHIEEAVKAFTDDVYYVNTGFMMKSAMPGRKEVYRNGGAKEFVAGKTVLFTHSSCFFFRSELLKEFDYLNPNYFCACEDAAFYADIALKYKGVFTNKLTSTYILNGENTSGMSGTNPDESFKCLETVKKIILQKQNDQ